MAGRLPAAVQGAAICRRRSAELHVDWFGRRSVACEHIAPTCLEPIAMTIAAIIVSVLVATGTAHQLPQSQVEMAYEVSKYYVYCIEDETSVEQWDLEQMKVRRGSDVCLLYTDTSVSSAQSWMDKNFPTHECYCNN
jgi:hypothetical protein